MRIRLTSFFQLHNVPPPSSARLATIPWHRLGGWQYSSRPRCASVYLPGRHPFILRRIRAMEVIQINMGAQTRDILVANRVAWNCNSRTTHINHKGPVILSMALQQDHLQLRTASLDNIAGRFRL